MKKCHFYRFNFFLSIILIINSAPSFAQDFYYDGEIGAFKSASAFFFSPSGYFYITDSETNEIYKMDTLGTTVKSTGGYGWQEASFDQPASVFSTTLNVYVSDKNNHRIQIFDKDLNFISTINTRNGNEPRAAFGYPAGCAVSNMGDIFILDGENKSVVKFDMNGRFSMRFGGYDAGQYALNAPSSLAILNNQSIMVADKSDIIAYDQFGMGFERLAFDSPIRNIGIYRDNAVINCKEQLVILMLEYGKRLSEARLIGMNDISEIVQGLYINNRLYLLTKERILLFNKKG